MHQWTPFEAAIPVSAVAALAVIVYGVMGLRQVRCDPPYARAYLTVALFALVLIPLMLLQLLSPVVGYSLICVALAGWQLFDLLQDEHARARQRRVAVLAPRPAADAVPTVWVALAAASALFVTPYVIQGEQRFAAAIVAVAALVMAAISWRIASAPVQLFGDNVRTERMRDRYSRSRKTGLTAVIAMGSIMVFTSFVNASAPVVLPVERTLQSVSWWTWAVSAVSLVAYCAYLGRHKSTTT